MPAKPINNNPTPASIGLNTSAPHLGGMPSRPINAGPAHGSGGAGGAGGTCSFNVARQNSSGALDTTPKIALLWWSTYFWDMGGGYPGPPSADRQYYKNAVAAFGGDTAFWNRLSQYGVTSGADLGSIDATHFGGSASLAETDIQNALTSRFSNLSQPPDPNGIFVIMLPQGTTSAYDTSSIFIGHHQQVSFNGKNYWYAVVEYSTNRTTMLSVITHEVYEAATDPDGSTGYWDPANGGETEIGDFCNLQTETMDGYPAQKVWSQSGCGCI